MKKQLVVLLIAGILYGCSKSGVTVKQNTSTGAQIVGKWYLKKSSYKIYESGKLFLSDSTVNEPSNYYQQFNSDGTCVTSGQSGVLTKTYTLNGDNLTINFDVPMTYTLSNITANSFQEHLDYTSGASETISDYYYSK